MRRITSNRNFRKQAAWALLLGAVLAAACGPARPAYTSTPPVAAIPTQTPLPTRDPSLPPAPPPGAADEFRTDFSTFDVDYRLIISPGPGKDDIPAIDEPVIISIAEAEDWLDAVEPVIRIEIDGQARAYPIQVLIWHEIVNDHIGDTPVAVTFCPLCNTGLAFLRTVDGEVLDFGTTGRLLYSNLITYDRQTESWWQQATGQAIVGAYTGSQLAFVNAPIISWEQFKENHPEGTVLSRETGFERNYGQNPYPGYDSAYESPFFFRGAYIPTDRLSPFARVLAVDVNGEAVAYDYGALEIFQIVNDEVGGQPIVVFWQDNVASPLDAGRVAEGRLVGSGQAFSRVVAGEVLEFRFGDRVIIDINTETVWNHFGLALEGPLAGTQLESVPYFNHFWFSWAVFRPDTQIYAFDEYPE